MFLNFLCIFTSCALVFFLHVCLCKSAVSSGTGVTDHCELPCVWWELNLDALEEQPLLTAEPSLQPYKFLLKKLYLSSILSPLLLIQTYSRGHTFSQAFKLILGAGSSVYELVDYSKISDTPSSLIVGSEFSVDCKHFFFCCCWKTYFSPNFLKCR